MLRSVSHEVSTGSAILRYSFKHNTHDEPSSDDRPTLGAHTQGSQLSRSRSLKVGRRPGSLLSGECDKPLRGEELAAAGPANLGRLPHALNVPPAIGPVFNMTALPPVRLTEAGHLA